MEYTLRVWRVDQEEEPPTRIEARNIKAAERYVLAAMREDVSIRIVELHLVPEPLIPGAARVFERLNAVNILYGRPSR